MTADPLDRPEVARKLAAVRLIGVALTGGLIATTVSIVGVVHFALDGIPLAGHGVRLAGLPLLSWVAAALAVAAPVAAVAVGKAAARNGVRKLAADRPEPSDADADPLAAAYTTGRFAELVLAEAAGVTCALFYHFTADPLMLGLVAGLVVFIAVRLPTAAAFREWYAAAVDQLADDRRLL